VGTITEPALFTFNEPATITFTREAYLLYEATNLLLCNEATICFLVVEIITSDHVAYLEKSPKKNPAYLEKSTISLQNLL